MSGPYQLNDGRTWALNVVETDFLGQVQANSIPGIRYDADNSRVLGAIDAVAAACMRLGIDPPNRPFIGAGDDRWWTSGDALKLRSYQINAITCLRAIQQVAQGALLASEPGVGKTLQAISLARLRGSKRVIIVAPGFARYTWQDELLKWGEPASSISLMLPKGDKHYRSNIERAPTARWVITSYELLPSIPGSRYPDHFIIDECHALKGRQTLRTKAVANLAALTPYRLGISATPAWNRPRDWWQVLTILLGRRFGSAHEFEAAYCNGHQGKYGWEADGLTRADELRKRLSYYMVRHEVRDIMAELPPLTRQVIWLDPDSTATNKLRAAMLKAVSVQSALEATLEAKMPAAIELAHQHKHFLLFTYRRDHAEAMQQRIYANGTPCVLMHGGMSVSARQEAVVQARSQQVGIVATLDSAGQSLNLQNIASTGIMHALDYVPSKTLQAEKRGHRMDSTHPFHWYYLALRESMDKLVWDEVISKLDQFRATMPGTSEATGLRDAGQGNEGGAGFDEKAALASIYERMSMEQEEQ